MTVKCWFVNGPSRDLVVEAEEYAWAMAVHMYLYHVYERIPGPEDFVKTYDLPGWPYYHSPGCPCRPGGVIKL